MNLSRRNLIIIGGVVVLLIVVITVVLWLSRDKGGLSEADFVPQVYDASNVSSQAAIAAGRQIDRQAEAAKAVARNFVERYLSFSNQNWGENIEALEVKMTEGMIQRSGQALIQLKNQYPSDQFYGVSAKVLSQKVLLAADNNYSFSNSIQLEETIGSDTQIVYKSYEVELIKVGDGWLVDNLSLVD